MPTATEAKPKFVKVYIRQPGRAGEGIWAIDRGIDAKGQWLVELNNVPFSGGYACGDIVNIDGSTHEVVKMVKRVGKTVTIRYNSDGVNADILKRFRALSAYLKEKDFKTEGFIAGVMGVTIPSKMTMREFDKILRDAPETAERFK